jgi:hypothetical protein
MLIIGDITSIGAVPPVRYDEPVQTLQCSVSSILKETSKSHRSFYFPLAFEYLKKRPVGRHSRRWEGNIKVNIQETGAKDVDWIYLTHQADSSEHGNEPSHPIRDCEFLDQVSDCPLSKGGPAPWSC